MAAATQIDRSRPNSLFYLPDELLIQVVSHLAGDAPTLCSLARVNRFFQIEAEKHIYTKIELLSTNDLHAIIEAFTRRFDRVASVETLKILYRFHGGLGATADERAVFNACVGGMKDLRNWEIESPYDNYKWNEGGEEWVLKDMEMFRTHLEAASLKAAAGSLRDPGGVGLSKLERRMSTSPAVESISNKLLMYRSRDPHARRERRLLEPRRVPLPLSTS